MAAPHPRRPRAFHTRAQRPAGTTKPPPPPRTMARGPGPHSSNKEAPGDGFAKGERHLPFARSRCRHTGRGPGRESPGRGCKGRGSPLRDGSRESAVSLAGMQRRNRCPGRTGSMPPPPGRIPCAIGRHQDGLIRMGDALRGSAGNRRVPPARCAWWYYHAHLVQSQSGTLPLLFQFSRDGRGPANEHPSH